VIRRIGPLARKEAIHIRRDPRSLYLAIGLPIFMIVLFGYAITLDIKHVAIGVVDQDRTALSREFAAKLAASAYFDLKLTLDSPAGVEKLLDEGRVKAVVVFPSGFARDVAGRRDTSIQVLLDGSNNNTALIAMGYISRLFQKLATDLLAEQAAREGAAGSAAAGGGAVAPGSLPSVEPRIRVWYNPDLNSTDFIIPGLVAVVMMVMAGILTSLAIAREWETGTMEQLISSPVRAHEIVFGKLLPYFVLGLAQLALVVGTGTLLFGVPLRGNLFSLLVASSVFLLCGLGIGLFLSIVARTQQLAFMLAILLTLLPAFLLSGFMTPISSMPRIIQAFTYLIPARYFIIMVRGIFLKGFGFGDIWRELLLLAAFAAIVLTGCVRRLKLRLD
jgi:ABC-2 type transport system permease protein